jgi:1,4-dihydroxy-2-naphthoate octaprenyltransferase
MHILVYPASNAFNSYHDKDTKSIGGLKNPPPVSKSLYWLSLIMDILALGVTLLYNLESALLLFGYISVSRLYSYRAIRLKKYPFLGFLSVVVFQGFVTFLIFYTFINNMESIEILNSGLLYPALASSFLIAGSYPLTQIYQHKQDLEDGVKTISYVLGYRGTFVFSSIMYGIAGYLFYNYFSEVEFMIFQIFLFPVAIYFMRWFVKVWIDKGEANFENTMRMNVIASSCMNICFILMIFIGQMI